MTEITPRADYSPRSLLSDVSAPIAKQITMQDVRAKFPQYSNVSDGDLLVGLYNSQYADQMHIKDFLGSIEGGMFAVQKTGTDLTRDKFVSAVNQPAPGETPDQTFQRTGGSANGPVGDSGGMAMNALRQGMQGATFGGGDELVAAGATVFGNKPYSENLQSERDKLSMGSDQYPATSMLANIGGSLAPGVPMAKAVGVGGPLAQSLRAAGTGAASGAAYGFGMGQGGLKERLANVPTAGAVGAVGGVVGPKLVQGLAKTGRIAARGIVSNEMKDGMGIGPNSMADRKVNDLLVEAMRGRKSLPSSSQYGPDMMLGDVLDNGSTMNGIVRSSGQGRDAIVNALKERQLGQGTRVIQGVEDAFGTSGSARKKSAALTEGRTLVANFDYGLAREQAVAVDPSVIIAKLRKAEAPIGVSGEIPKGTGKTKIAKVMGKYRKMLVNKKGKKVTDYEALLAVRKDMGDEAFKLKVKHPHAASQLRAVRDSMDELLASGSPSYKKALNNYREESQIIDDLKLGGEMNNGSIWRHKDTVNEFNKIAAPRTPSGHVFKKPTPSGVSPTADMYTQHAYEKALLLANRRADAVRSGYTDKITGRIAMQRPYADKTAGLVRGNLKTHSDLMGMAKDPKGLGRILNDESKMHETFAKVTGGSKTADNAADALKVEGIDPSVIGALISGKPVRAAVNLGRGMVNVATNNSPSFREALARRLLAKGASFDAAIEMALKREKKIARVRAIQTSTKFNAVNAETNRRKK